MKSNREMRAMAWKIVRGPWLWRLVTVGFTLNVIAQFASLALRRAFQRLDIQTWQDFWVAKARAIQSGMDLTVPSSHLAWQMTGATSCEYFVAYVFASILAFGFAIATLKSTKDEQNRWLADSFSGFRRPLELAWLMFSMNLRVILWSLLLVVPGLIAAYRYRLSWYLKGEHPDWKASECMASSAKLMYGYKWQAFAFDLGYLAYLLLALMLAGAGTILSATGVPLIVAIGSVIGGIGVFALFFVLCYFFVGRAVFYRELPKTPDVLL